MLVGAAGAADPSYAPSGGLAVGRLPNSFAAADLNRDGHVDFAVGNQGSDDLTVLLGDGAGGFNAAAGSPIAAGDGPSEVEAADLNADGKTDLAVADSDSNEVRVLIGDGSGGFAPGYSRKPGGSPAEVAAADLNRDGNVDLALPICRRTGASRSCSETVRAASPWVACRDRGPSRDDPNRARRPERRRSSRPHRRQQRPRALVRFGVGDGRFGAARTVAAGNAPSALAVADLNRDGRLDLAVGTQASDAGKYQPRLMIMLGNGTGGFRRAAGSPMAVPGAPSSLQVADLNSDGRLDVAVANSDADSVTVLLGNGAGRFRPAADSPFSVPSPMELAAGDLNGDGGLDFAVAGPDGFRVPFRRRPHLRPRAAALCPGDRRSFSTRGLITKLAADGNRVAVKATAQSSRSCGQIIVSTAPGRRTKSFSTSNLGCGSILCPRGSGCR